MPGGQPPSNGFNCADSAAGIDPAERLAERLGDIVSPGTAIVCVGNELRGDDAAGTAVAGRIAAAVPWDVYDTQTAPESFLVKIASRKPASVLLIDAIHFGGEPGAVKLFAPEDIGGQGPSTHGPAPLAFLEALRMMHPCRCAVLGIQPKQADLGAPLSEPVRQAVDLVVRALTKLAESAGPSHR